MKEGLKGLRIVSKVRNLKAESAFQAFDIEVCVIVKVTCQQIVLKDYSKLDFVKYWKRQTRDSVFCGVLGHAASCRAEDSVFCCG